MPIVNVEGVGQVKFPDSMTKDEIASAILANTSQLGFVEGAIQQFGKNFDVSAANIGMALPFLDTAGKAMGLAPSLQRLSQRQDRPISGASQFAGDVASAAPLAIAAGPGLIGQALAGALSSGLMSEKDQFTNAALGGALGGAGAKLGKMIAAPKVATPELQSRIAATKEAQAAGYVIPPALMNPDSAIAKIAEGFAGKLTTGQAASIKNQGVTNRLVAQSLGLPEDQPITPQALSAIRKNAGAVYDQFKGVGRITADQKYFDDLSNIAQKYTGAQKDFPELAKSEVMDMVQSIAKPDFDASSAIDVTKILREKADKAFASGDKSLGGAYKAASEAVESTLERNLTALGNPEMTNAFRNARQAIAKTYSVEKALNAQTGAVNAQKLVKDLEKGRLTGGMAQAAKAARAFKPATQEVTSSMPGISPIDFAVGGIGASAAANPAMLAMVAARPAVRSAILTPFVQRTLQPSLPKNVVPGLLDAIGAGGYIPQTSSALLQSLLGEKQ